MAVHLLVCLDGPVARPRGRRALPAAKSEARAALTLIELLVVLFIISILFSLMLPAIQSARAKAQATSCQNNVRQLGFALRAYISTANRFPVENQWSTCLLRWIEEWELADVTSGGVPPNTVLGRPPLFRCPAQADVDSNVPTVGPSHYVLVVDRPVHRIKPDRVRWDLQDRQELTETEVQAPWYRGPEMTFADQQGIIARRSGPHLSGVFYSHTGAVYPAD
jgi:prepilin-type N-terminal cleavage/methylation domain-containing protein